MRYKGIVFLGKERIKLILFSRLLANKAKNVDIDSKSAFTFAAIQSKW